MPRDVDQIKRILEMKTLASRKSGSLLTKSWRGSKHLYRWQCQEGHTWKATWSSVSKNGSWCPKCMARVRAKKKSLSTETVNQRFRKRGLELVGEYRPGEYSQLCRCLKCGKQTKANFHRLPKGYGCKSCLKLVQPTYRRNSIAQVEQELKTYGAQLISDYRNVDSSVLLRCLRCDTDFRTSLSNLRKRQKHNCKDFSVFTETVTKYLETHSFILLEPVKNMTSPLSIKCLICGSSQQKTFSAFRTNKTKCSTCEDLKTFHKMKKFAEDRGGKLEASAFLGLKSSYKWKCSAGHTWTAMPTFRSWCPTCAGKNKSLSDVQEVVKSRGGRLQTSVFRGTSYKYQVLCSLGHDFSISLSKMNQGQWCSICSKGSKSEELVRTTMEQIFGVPFKRIRPSWLRGSKGSNLELDGYNDKLKIAFEYQGKQHYERAKYLEDHDLKRVIENDKFKAKVCASRGISLFIFSYKQDYRDFPSLAVKQAKDFGILPVDFALAKPVDFNRAYIREDRISELRSRARQRDIEVLSSKWLGTTAIYKVKCLKCKNSYEVSGTAFMGRKINRCRFCVLRQNFNKSTLSIQEAQAYADKFKGILVSTTYKNMHTPLDWKCKENHQFKAALNNLVRRKQFCPYCEGRSVRKA